MSPASKQQARRLQGAQIAAIRTAPTAALEQRAARAAAPAGGRHTHRDQRYA
jgi:hypothetical protein